MTTRAISIPWSTALTLREGLLDDLATWTDVNTIIVSVNYAEPSEYEGGSILTAIYGTGVAVRSAEPFGELPVRVLDTATLDSLLEFVEMAKAKGLKVACNVHPIVPNTSSLTSLSCIDITGQRAVEEGHIIQGCPNNPETVRYGCTLLRELVASWPSLDMLDLNHLEYPRWPHLGLRELFVCFCDSCRDEASRQGINFDEMRREAASLYDTLTTRGSSASQERLKVSANAVLNFLVQRPALAVWLGFRISSMSAFIRKIVEAAREAAKEHNPGLQIGIDFHLPSISNLAGTDFVALHGIFDWISPKLPEYVPGAVIPLIAEEIATSTGRWSTSEIAQAVRELFDLGPGPEVYQPAAAPSEAVRYSNTFATSIIHTQMKLLEPLSGKVSIIPLLFYDKPDFSDVKEHLEALRTYGFDGYFIWGSELDLTRESFKPAKGIF